MDDKRIIELFFARSEQAITEVQIKYGWLCREISVNILRSESDAEECANDVYLALWNTIPPAHPDPLVTYVARVARNQSIKRYHKNTAKKRNSHYDTALSELEGCIPDGETVEELFRAEELATHFDAFLDTLSKKNRVIFVRRYYFSEPVAEIAKKMHMEPRKVTLSLSRTREKLKQYLQKKGVFL